MEPFCRIMLVLALTLQLLMSVDNQNLISFVRRAGYGVRNSAAAASSPLAGTKIRQPWVYPVASAVPPGNRYIPSVFDVYRNPDLTKLLDVGACNNTDYTKVHTFSYVPPLDGTNPDYKYTLCQDLYGMRFVLFDLKLVNIDTVDSLSGSFTAQFQLVFHWVEGWEGQFGNVNESYVYLGDEIKTADGASTCGFDCDSTAAVKTMCCDRMWVPPLQVPSCKVNDVQSVTPPPYLRTTYSGNWSSHWKDGEGDYTQYSTRRTWYVGLDVTCPFTSDFRNFPFDHQFLTVDIINPYSSRTWLQLNKGFLEANIIDSIAGIDLFPDDKIDGWTIEDLTVSSPCGTQQTWKPTFLTQDYLLQILGHDYESQNDTITSLLKDIKCAEIKNLISKKNISLSIPTNKQPYNDTMNDYIQRLNATIVKYKECTSSKFQGFKWRDKIDLHNHIPDEVQEFNYSDVGNMNRSFSFLDLEYLKPPVDGINFQCLIDAVASLTTPGIRINIIIQRFPRYYIVKLFLPTCACVAFSFTSFALGVDELLGRLTVIVPSAIALSALQGFVVATDIPAVAYVAPTTYIILLSYVIQLLIALESICLKFRAWICVFRNQGSAHQSNESLPLKKCNARADALDTPAVDTQHSCKTKEIEMVDQSHHATQKNSLDGSQLNDRETQEEEEKQQSRLSKARKNDLICCGSLVAFYILVFALLITIPWLNASIQKKKKLHSTHESLWN